MSSGPAKRKEKIKKAGGVAVTYLGKMKAFWEKGHALWLGLFISLSFPC